MPIARRGVVKDVSGSITVSSSHNSRLISKVKTIQYPLVTTLRYIQELLSYTNEILGMKRKKIMKIEQPSPFNSFNHAGSKRKTT